MDNMEKILKEIKKDKKKVELFRQAIHSSLGLIFIVLVYFFGVTAGFSFALSLLVIGLMVSMFLKYNIEPKFLKQGFGFFRKIISTVERPYEKNWPGKGAITFLAGLVLVIIFFPQRMIIIAAAIVLSFGDGASTIFGERFGKTKIAQGKSLEGTLAGMLVAGLILSLFYPAQIAIAVALIGLMAEYVPVNDNYTVPIATALALKLVFGM